VSKIAELSNVIIANESVEIVTYFVRQFGPLESIGDMQRALSKLSDPRVWEKRLEIFQSRVQINNIELKSVSLKVDNAPNDNLLFEPTSMQPACEGVMQQQRLQQNNPIVSLY